MLHLSLGLDIYIAFISFVLGACVGSFLNCMSWRIVHGMSPLKGRSVCDVCGHTLSAADLVPIFSYIFHRGKCRYCGAKLSSAHLFAETLTGLVFLIFVFRYDISLQLLEMLLFACILLASSFADLEGYIIPDRYVIAGIVLRIPFYFLLPDFRGNLIDSLIGGFAVGGGLLLLVLVYEKIRKIEAMGGGDIKLLFVTGLYLGWAKNILCLLLACLLGIIFALVTQKIKQKKNAKKSKKNKKKKADADDASEKIFPWGPSIAAAAIIALLVGDKIIKAYLQLF